MSFEWDDKKNEANKVKHGISFAEAIEIFDDPTAIEFDAKTTEPRIVIIGMIAERLWTLVYTVRNENRRIISCRRASEGGRGIYEEGQNLS